MKRPDKPVDPCLASGCASSRSDPHLSLNSSSLSDQAVSLIVQRIMELPPVTKKMMALYYHENTQLSEIAACFDLPESRISEMHRETVALLRSYILNALA